MADALPAQLRPGTAGDNHACFQILMAAVNDLARRIGAETFGEDDPEGTWQHMLPFFGHLTETAAEFWVAEAPDSGELIGYARSIERDGLFELTEFFVRPAAQAAGLGAALLQRAFPDGRGDPRVIIATTDRRALSRYFRAGVVARVPIATFTGTARASDADPSLEVVHLEGEEDLDVVDAVDYAVLGHRRTVDHRWLRTQREAYVFRRSGRVAGYGYVGLPNGAGSGPFAATDPADLPALMAHAESRRAELGATDIAFDVALSNQLAMAHLLGRGYRIDQFQTLLLSSAPLGSLDGYVFTGPPLIL
jgi:GNAT superfamily N-acetyltransferase